MLILQAIGAAGSPRVHVQVHIAGRDAHKFLPVSGPRLSVCCQLASMRR